MIRLQAPPPPTSPLCPDTDPDLLDPYREDASGAPPGSLQGVIRPDSETQAAAFLATHPDLPVLFQAGRTSLTAGALPNGECVISVEKLDRIGSVETDAEGNGSVRVQPGVRLSDLLEHLAERGWDFPPVPTYLQAMIGGAVSTNAGGAATFKYGTMRDWVDGLRVILTDGAILAVDRGQCLAAPGERFDVERSDGTPLPLIAPTYSLPALKKISAGYHVSDPLDLVDLFVGSEGTLGMIAEIRLRLQPLPAGVASAIVFHDDEDEALDFAAELRQAAVLARSQRDPEGPDIRSIEWLDRRSLDLVREPGVDRQLGLAVPAKAASALIFEIEFAQAIDGEQAEKALGAAFEGDLDALRGSPLAGWLRPAMRDGLLDRMVLALPGDDESRSRIRRLREAVPLQVQERLKRGTRRDAGMGKTGGDLIVPMERLREMIEVYRRGFQDRGIPYAIWGHLSDGNLHPNALPQTDDQRDQARELMLEFGQQALDRGGCPLSEHGVGRNPIKQELLRRFHGEAALEQMRAVRRTLDPVGRFAPGVLFS